MGLREAVDQINILKDIVLGEYRDVSDRLSLINQQLREAMKDLVSSMSDEEIVQDPKVFRWLRGTVSMYPESHARMKQIMAIDAEEVTMNGIDVTDEGNGLCALRLALQYRQDVTELADKLYSWIQRNAFGRKEIFIHVMDHTLSYHGSYRIRIDVDRNAAILLCTRYGHTEEVSGEGPLSEVLKVAAKEAWYEGGPDDEWTV